MNSIEWTKKATKQLLKIDRTNQQSIFQGVQELKGFPDCQNVKALVNHEYAYRLRIGRFRVFFEFVSQVKIIRIEEVKKRDERTY
jgi:mRNA-degrading endonuclease RelE of RelBE toxin-antitoxin system